MLRFFLRTGLVSAAAVLFFTGSASAQTRRPSAKPRAVASTTPTAAPRAAMGTFQLVERSLKRTVVLTTESLVEIERRRHATEETRWELNEYAYVRILPRNVISAPGFRPVEPVVPATH